MYSILVSNAQISLASGAPPQTPNFSLIRFLAIFTYDDCTVCRQSWWPNFLVVKFFDGQIFQQNGDGLGSFISKSSLKM